MTYKGRLEAISISDIRGVPKDNIPEADLREGHGIMGDAHAGAWHRQVSILAQESIDKMKARGAADLDPGIFAENLTTSGIVPYELPIGTRLRIGSDALVEVAQIGKHCHNGCTVYNEVGDCVMPREGIFVTVIKSGHIRVGDDIEVLVNE